jgi:hypothetical protein
MRFRLMTPQTSNGSTPIKQGRRYVGSVRRAENGIDYVGRIGAHAATGPMPEIAFREVAARAMGFANLAALRASNSATRARNRARRVSGAVRRILTPQPAVGPIDDEPFSG